MAAGLAVALLLMGGCNGGEAAPAPTESVSKAPPSSSASTAPAQSSIPPEARQMTRAGASAFAVYFFEEFSRAMQTGDVAAWRSVFLPSCTTCTRFANDIERVYRSGFTYRTQGWRVTNLDITDSRRAGRDHRLIMAVVQTRRDMLDEAQQVVRTSPREQNTLGIEVTWRNEHWTTVDFVDLEL
jgi:hypothetical protein